MTRVAAALIILLISAISTFGGDSAQSRETLRGVKNVRVEISVLTDKTPKFVVDQDLLRNDVELKLRLAGIQVGSTGDDILLLEVNLDSSSTPLWGYHFQISFLQPALVVRGATRRMLPTWSVAMTGSLVANGNNTQGTTEGVRARTKNLVDFFINAFLSVNPKV